MYSIVGLKDYVENSNHFVRLETPSAADPCRFQNGTIMLISGAGRLGNKVSEMAVTVLRTLRITLDFDDLQIHWYIALSYMQRCLGIRAVLQQVRIWPRPEKSCRL